MDCVQQVDSPKSTEIAAVQRACIATQAPRLASEILEEIAQFKRIAAALWNPKLLKGK